MNREQKTLLAIAVALIVVVALPLGLWSRYSAGAGETLSEETATATPLPVRASTTTSTTTSAPTTTSTHTTTTTSTTTSTRSTTTAQTVATAPTTLPPTTEAPPTTETLPTTPAPAVSASSVPGYAQGVAGAENVPPILWAIARCEGALNPETWDPWTLYNFAGSSASGPWQIIRSTWAGHGGYTNAADAPPHVQIEKAMILYETRGTQPWNPSKSCWS